MDNGDTPEALKSPTPGTNLEQPREAHSDDRCVLNRALIDFRLTQ